MTSRKFTVLLVALTVSGVASAARADVIYDNGGPGLDGGDEMTGWIQADMFSLTNDGTLTGIHFWDLEQTGAFTGSIYYAIYADNGGVPGLVLKADTVSAVTRTDTGMADSNGLELWENDLAIGGLDLLAGNYWLGLHNGSPLTATAAQGFYLDNSPDGSLPFAQEQIAPFSGAFGDNGSEKAFFLTGTVVPEPSAMTLLGLGLMVAAVARVSRKRAA
jgi:hypothetical protein